jgi:hypothetical protein
MESFYLTVTSGGKGHFSETNEAGRFRVHLGRPLNLKGSWEVGLAEIHIPSTLRSFITTTSISGGGSAPAVELKKTVTETDGKKANCDLLHLGCDLITDQQLDHGSHNILRTVNIKKEKYTQGTIKTHSFGKIFYYTVKKNHVTDIDFYITTDAGEQASFASGVLILLLHFRPALLQNHAG